MFVPLAFIAVAASLAQASPSPTLFERDLYVRMNEEAPRFIMPRAASCTFPSPPKTSSLSAPRTIKSGEVFDGGNVRFDRGSGACEEQKEGDDEDAVFLIESGGTLQNVVIGKDQAEGVHCLGSCNLYNVWFEDTCEDAITIKQTSGTSNIIGGGAKSGSDKLVQHNGGGNVNINHYCAQNSGKLYRSCGNCSTMYKRTVSISNSIVSSLSVLAGVNSNYGDVATIYIDTLTSSSVKSRCDTYKGNDQGDEPTKLTSNVANGSCVFKTGSYAGPSIPSSSVSSTTTSRSTSTSTSTTSRSTSTSTTSRSTSTSTSTRPTTSSSSSSSGGCTSAIYYQCGGQGFTGCTTCASGLSCVFQNDWYSQCLPA